MEADHFEATLELKTVDNGSEGVELVVGIQEADKEETAEEELQRLIKPKLEDLPVEPPSSVEFNFARYYAPGLLFLVNLSFLIYFFFFLSQIELILLDFIKEGHDQYVYRHANGLCVIGLAPTHVAFKDEGGVIEVDFNVGKSDRSSMKVTGKRKRNAQHFESNTALCKVNTKAASYIVRCCVKGSLLEVNNRLSNQPELLNASAERDGYIAIIMPKPADWLKIKSSLITHDDYIKLRKT
ncbi:hypothetical protein QQ045_015280 [Rhodiola kirilowii]